MSSADKNAGDNDPLPGLTIRMMGPFVVAREDGVTPLFRSQKTKWLLAFLALQQGCEVEFALLKNLFWPEEAGREAGSDQFVSVRQSLANLRAVFSSRRFDKPSRHSVRLCMEALSVDMYVFDAGIREGTDEALRRAVEHYTGDLLADCSEVWVKAERNRRRQEYIQALKTLAGNELAAGCLAEAEQYLRRLTAAEPSREEWTVELIRLLLKRSEAGMAEEVYQQYLAHYPETKLNLKSEIIKIGAALAPMPKSLPATAVMHPAADETLSHKADAALFQHAIPSLLEPLVGREEAVREIAARLAFSRMVTLKGAPGVGKTQMALQVGSASRGDYPDGVLFVDLTQSTNLHDLLLHLMSRLNISRRSDADEQETLIEFFQSRRMLLVLDNCERLVEAITPFIKTLLTECPRLRLLTTSRLAWRGLSAQFVYHVKGLSAPEPTRFQNADADIELLLQCDAVRLYLREAAKVLPDISLTSNNAYAIAQLCHQLDGSPLGIKLAALQAQIRSPSATLAGLLQNPLSLQSFHDDLPERQRSLWLAFESSFTLLNADLQHMFACLSVFPAGWTIAGAQAVIKSRQTGAMLQQLADLSLVSTLPFQEPTRFQMTKMLHRFALERLNLLPAANTIRQRFLDFCLHFVSERENKFAGPEQSATLDQIEMEWDNLKGALEWAESTGKAEQGLRLASLLWRYWFFRGDNLVGADWLKRMLALCPNAPADLRAAALQAAGNLAFQRVDYEQAQAYYQEQLDIEKSRGDLLRLARTHGNLGNVGMMIRDHESAQRHLEMCSALLKQTGNDRELSMTLGNLAILARQMGNYPLASHYHTQAVAVLKRLGDSHNHITALNNFADTQIFIGDCAAASETLRHSLSLCIESNHRLGMVHNLFLHARLAMQIDMMEIAARFLGAARGTRERSGLTLHVQAVAEQRECCETIRDHIGTATLDCALDEGRVMNTAQLADCAEEIYKKAANRSGPDQDGSA